MLGGPIRKNKLWFLFAQRVSQTNNLVAFPVGVLPGFPNGTQVESGGFIVAARNGAPDVAGIAAQQDRVGVLQVAGRHPALRRRLRLDQRQRRRLLLAGSRVRAADSRCSMRARLKWTSPITSRVLLEVGQSLAVQTYNFSYQPENGPLDIQHRSATTGLRTVASSTAPSHYFSQIWNTVANVSFVTGSHNVKAGINQQSG